MKIEIRKLVSENAITLDDGVTVYELIHPELVAGHDVELDFSGVNVFASPFFNAGIGRLLADVTPSNLNCLLKISHISGVGDRILRRVVDNAKEYYAANAAERKSIDEAVHRGAITL